jgi:hypothetical protein
MLNDWSDRQEPQPCRLFILSAEFAAGVFLVFAGIALVVGVVEWIAG